ncbi:MAG: hypothetical protein ACK5IJ_07535 [Mangrovibacterium sp.]
MSARISTPLVSLNSLTNSILKMKHLLFKCVRTSQTLQLLVFAFCLQSCSSSFEQESDLELNQQISIKSIPIDVFNWEVVNWMPTPSGQSPIPVPWAGQGSIASMYSLDVVNDNKKIDGWELIYSTFSSTAPGKLVNPYFMLYNKYRGVLRIYLYTTTEFVQSSTYLQDGLSIVSPHETNMLNFLGDELIDVSVNKKIYSQMQPKPSDGSLPLASNKWYMLQYEIAYDDNISNMYSSDIMLSWYTNFYNVSNVELFGKVNGSINGTIGHAGNENLFSKLGDFGETVGTVALSAVGVDFISKNTISSSGENKLNLPNDVFLAMAKGVNSALSSATSKTPAKIVNVLNGLISGAGSSAQSVDLKFNAEVVMEGNTTNCGSFPSSPTSVYIPGTKIPNSAQGYLPNYTSPLGVFYLKDRPIVRTKNLHGIERDGSPREGFNITHNYSKVISKVDNSDKIVLNEQLLKSAGVKLVDEDVIFIRKDPNSNVPWYLSGGTIESIGAYSIAYVNCSEISSRRFISAIPAIRMTIEVTPNNGRPPIYIIHTFLANEEQI